MKTGRLGVSNLSCWNGSAIFLFCVAAAIGSSAQTLTTLADFNGSNGADNYYAGLIQATNGNFYGTTDNGGTPILNTGTVFEVSRTGSLTSLYSFCATSCLGGAFPIAGVIQATDGNLYGTTSGGGINGFSGCNGIGCGTVFKMTLQGTETTLHSFTAIDGGSSETGLIQASDGNFYGTTSAWGSNCSSSTCGGTVFQITPGGVLTTLHSFCAQAKCADGSLPYAGLVQATDGNFYGTTAAGGTHGRGTIFQITRAGKLTTLYNFCSQTNCTDGSQPFAGLVQGTDGNFYGATQSGGNGGKGTIFQVTPAGALTTLYRFCSGKPPCLDGESPYGTLIQGTDGKFYGTTTDGGVNCVPLGCGTLFTITPAGILTTLYSFCSQPSCADGDIPNGPLLQATDGNIYGVTVAGGTEGINGQGTIYRWSAGLGPFVALVQKSGKVGQIEGILGQGFTGTTDVSVNGTPANFAVISDTFIKARVPAGATTGFVTVTTPSGTLTSNLVFRVRP